MNEEVCHLTVFWVLFQTSVPTLWTAEPRLIKGTDQLTRNGHKGKVRPRAGLQSGNPTPTGSFLARLVQVGGLYRPANAKTSLNLFWESGQADEK